MTYFAVRANDGDLIQGDFLSEEEAEAYMDWVAAISEEEADPMYVDEDY